MNFFFKIRENLIVSTKTIYSVENNLKPFKTITKHEII